MKILFVSEHFHPKIAGGENWALQLTSGLARRGHEVHVVTSRLPGTKKSETFRRVHVHRPFSGSRLGFMIKLSGFLNDFIRDNEIDVVHNLANVPTLPATRAAKRNDVPCLTSIHLSLGSSWFTVTDPLRAMFNWLAEDIIFAFSPHSAVHVTAERTRNRLSRLTRAPIRIIYNAVDDPEITKVNIAKVRKKHKVKGKLLIFIGSLIPVKNVAATVRSLKKMDDDFTFLIVGEGPEKSRIGDHLDDRMRLLGPIYGKEKTEILMAADGLILMSRSEQSPLVVYESLAVKTPVIARPVGGIPDLAGMGNDIRLIDNPDLLPVAIRTLPNPSSGIDKDFVKRFSEERMLDEFEKLYESL